LRTSKAKPAEKQGNQKLPEKAKSGCKGHVGVVDLLRGKEKVASFQTSRLHIGARDGKSGKTY
jgi:hypothetical protein